MSTVSSKSADAAAVGPPKPSLGGPARGILTVQGIFIVTQIIAGVIAEVLLRISGSQVALEDSAAAQFVYVLLAEGGAAGLVFLVLKERRLKLKSIGLGRRPRWRDLQKAGLGFLAFYGLLIIAGIAVNWLAPSITNEQQDVGFNTISTLSDNVFAALALIIMPPLGEETLVRGYLYSGLRSRWKFWPALLVTSVLFGAAHLSSTDSGLLWSGALDTFLLSVVLVYLRENTGALYAGMLVHMANNVIAFAVHFH